MVVGVNGAGKTTTIAKLASKYQKQGLKVVVGAGDTFRAAAVDQIKSWTDKVNATLVTADEGAKPSTVAYKAVHQGKEEGADVVILDTAGRLHTKINLMNELESVRSIIEREHPGAPNETILVVDGATGQNALQQAKEFNEKVPLTGVVVTKLDGTPRGGIVVAIKNELNIPIRYIGVGETEEDLRIFSPEKFADALFSPIENLDTTKEYTTGNRIKRKRSRV